MIDGTVEVGEVATASTFLVRSQAVRHHQSLQRDRRSLTRSSVGGPLDQMTTTPVCRPGVVGYGDRVSPPPDPRDTRDARGAWKVRWRRAVATGRSSRLIERARSGVLVGGVRGRPAALVEVIVLLLGFLLFTYLHAAAGKDVASATANALTLQSVERALHLDIEQMANRWLTEHPALIPLAVYYYRSYYAVIVGVLLWIFVRHADIYLKVRRTLLAMTALAPPVFWALPMSPPRFALPGVVDIVAEHDILGSHASREMGNGQNHYSAMPSLHVGWSAWCAYAVWSALRASHPRLALLSWVFPLVMAVDVLTTGNHYVLDIVGSAVLLGVAVAAASVCGRLAERWRRARSAAIALDHPRRSS
jgi:hypothetical protein